MSTEPDTLLSKTDTLGVFAVKGDRNTSIFLTNWNIKGQPIVDQEARVTLMGSSHTKAVAYRIDNTHANAYPLWVSMGKPLYLSPKQVLLLKQASELVAEVIPVEKISPNTLRISVTVPANSVVNVVLV